MLVRLYTRCVDFEMYPDAVRRGGRGGVVSKACTSSPPAMHGVKSAVPPASLMRRMNFVSRCPVLSFETLARPARRTDL